MREKEKEHDRNAGYDRNAGEITGHFVDKNGIPVSEIGKFSEALKQLQEQKIAFRRFVQSCVSETN